MGQMISTVAPEFIIAAPHTAEIPTANMVSAKEAGCKSTSCGSRSGGG